MWLSKSTETRCSIFVGEDGRLYGLSSKSDSFQDGLVKEMVWKKMAVVLVDTHSSSDANVEPALSIDWRCFVDFVFPSVMWIFYNKELKWYHKKILLWPFAAFAAIAAAISPYSSINHTHYLG